MAADERETLLKYKGDASGAKQAAEEAKRALGEVDDATQESARTQEAASEKAKDALGEQGRAAEETADGFGGLTKEMGLSVAQAVAFRRALSAMNPELAAMLGLAAKGGKALDFLFSPKGMATVSVGAGIAGVTLLLQAMQEEARKAEERIDAVNDSVRSLREQRRTGFEEVSDTLARAGIVSEEATTQAGKIERELIREGFAPEAARQVLPFAVDESGKRQLDDEQLRELAARAEFGRADLGFEDPRQIERVRERELRRAGRDQEMTDKLQRAVEQRRARQTHRLGQRDPDAILRELERQGEAIPEDEAQRGQMVQDIISVASIGRISVKGLEGGAEDDAEYDRRKQNAIRGAVITGLLEGRKAGRAQQVTRFDAEYEDVGSKGVIRGLLDLADLEPLIPDALLGTETPADERKRVREFRRRRASIEPAPQRAAATTEPQQPAGEPAPVKPQQGKGTTIINHGTINMGKAANRRVQRVPIG